MSDNVTRCSACFERYDGSGKCPFCGYDPDTVEADTIVLAPGTVLKNRYTIGRVLGQGGFGITYLAWDELFRNRVAIKEYLPVDYSTRGRGENRITVFSGAKTQVFQNGKKRFIEEAQALAVFQEESAIVSVKDFFQENGTAYFAMEYIDGCTLAEYIRHNGAYSVEETVRLMLPIIGCLEKIHARGLLHRDIAPDNIMVTKDGQAKLIDFGSARYAAFTTNEKSLTVMVKQGYSAPEQYMTRGARGPFTDVYALGATMYKMLTGVTPPESLERKTGLMEDGTDSLEPITKYASGAACLEPVILAAMDVYAAKRIQTAKELYDRVADAVSRTPAPDRDLQVNVPIIEDIPESEMPPVTDRAEVRDIDNSDNKTIQIDDPFGAAAPGSLFTPPSSMEPQPFQTDSRSVWPDERTIYDVAAQPHYQPDPPLAFEGSTEPLQPKKTRPGVIALVVSLVAICLIVGVVVLVNVLDDSGSASYSDSDETTKKRSNKEKEETEPKRERIPSFSNQSWQNEAFFDKLSELEEHGFTVSFEASYYINSENDGRAFVNVGDEIISAYTYYDEIDDKEVEVTVCVTDTTGDALGNKLNIFKQHGWTIRYSDENSWYYKSGIVSDLTFDNDSQTIYAAVSVGPETDDTVRSGVYVNVSQTEVRLSPGESVDVIISASGSNLPSYYGFTEWSGNVGESSAEWNSDRGWIDSHSYPLTITGGSSGDCGYIRVALYDSDDEDVYLAYNFIYVIVE